MSGAPITNQRFEENRHRFRDYVFARTAHNYKFWIVSLTAPLTVGGEGVERLQECRVGGVGIMVVMSCAVFLSCVLCASVLLDSIPVCSHHTPAL